MLPANQTPNPLAGLRPGGVDKIETQDISIPRINIVKPTSVGMDPSQIGKYLNSATGEAKSTMEVVFFNRVSSRVMYPEEYSPGQGIHCASSDGVQARQKFLGTDVLGFIIPSSCNACVWSQWDKDANGKGIPPKCHEQTTFMGLDIETGRPFSFTVTHYNKSNSDCAKKINFIMMTSGFSRIRMFVNKGTSNSGNVFYNPDVELLGGSDTIPIESATWLATNLGGLLTRAPEVDMLPENDEHSGYPVMAKIASGSDGQARRNVLESGELGAREEPVYEDVIKLPPIAPRPVTDYAPAQPVDHPGQFEPPYEDEIPF